MIAPLTEGIESSSPNSLLSRSPTFDEYRKYPSHYEQILTSGWLGYGDHAVYFPTATTAEIEAEIAFLTRSVTAKHRTRTAYSLERFVAERLGVGFALHVPCGVGVADIVTTTAVIEVKSNLDRNTFFSALGQVLLYRQAINPQLSACIVGVPDPNDNLDGLVEVAKTLGVEVLLLPRHILEEA